MIEQWALRTFAPLTWIEIVRYFWQGVAGFAALGLCGAILWKAWRATEDGR
jgi:hypothetical protein